MHKHTLWGLCALLTVASTSLWGAEPAKPAETAAPVEKASPTELVLDAATQAKINALSQKDRATWDNYTPDQQKLIIETGVVNQIGISLPCGMNWTTIALDVATCALSQTQSACGAIISDAFEACCPSGSAFGSCANPFLSVISSVDGYNHSVASALLDAGFNTSVCRMSPRVPHLGLLAGGDPKGNMAGCMGTLSITDEAKTFIADQLTGAPLSSMSDCGNPRYQLLQNAINWGTSPIDCLGGQYSDYCTGKESGTPTWGSGCS